MIGLMSLRKEIRHKFSMARHLSLAFFLFCLVFEIASQYQKAWRGGGVWGRAQGRAQGTATENAHSGRGGAYCCSYRISFPTGHPTAFNKQSIKLCGILLDLLTFTPFCGII